jgi:hypothetical protein
MGDGRAQRSEHFNVRLTRVYAVNAECPGADGAALHEVCDRRAASRLDGDAARTQGIRKRAGPITDKRYLVVRFRDVHRDGQLLASSECRDRLIERPAHGVRSVWRYSEARGRRGQRAQVAHCGLQLQHAGVALCRIRAEHFVIHDPAPAKIMERAHDRSGAARLGDARNTATPAVSDSRDRCLVERIGTRRLLQLTNATNPRSELQLFVPPAARAARAAREMVQLEVCVTIDETWQEIGIGEVQRLHAGRRGDLDMLTDAGNTAGPIDKDGAILNGWRRDGVDASGADAKQLRYRLSAMGYRLDPIADSW